MSNRGRIISNFPGHSMNSYKALPPYIEERVEECIFSVRDKFPFVLTDHKVMRINRDENDQKCQL